MQEITKAGLDVLAERERQIEVEGWTAEHDDKWSEGELAAAAACYALSPLEREAITGFGGQTLREGLWPWDEEWWKPKGGRRRQLVKAAALLLAEIDRMDRAARG